MLISDGELNRTELSRSGKTEEWLQKTLKKRGISSYSEIFIASLDFEDGLFLQKKGEKDQK